jgi:nitrite reductase/ring-hydroxylating ferredoxin subunit
MPAFIEVAHVGRLASEKGAIVTTGNNTVALFKIDGVIYAVEAWCLRCGTCLTEGSLEGLVVACRGCDWRYEVTTGSVVGMPALRLYTFKAQVVAGQVIIADA